MAVTRPFPKTLAFDASCGSISTTSTELFNASSTPAAHSQATSRPSARPLRSLLAIAARTNGRAVDESRLQVIRDWPPCKNLHRSPRVPWNVRNYPYVQSKIMPRTLDHSYNSPAKTSTSNSELSISPPWNTLKHLASTCPAIRAIDYSSPNEVILAVDSSWMAVGFILSQMGDDKKRYPARFGSITWNEREQRYSQAKIELYGLFRALKSHALVHHWRAQVSRRGRCEVHQGNDQQSGYTAQRNYQSMDSRHPSF